MQGCRKRHRVLVLQRGNQLLREQRVALRGLDHPRPHVRHKRSARQTFRDELDLARVERLEEHGVDVSARCSPRRARFEQLRSGQAEEEERFACRVCEVLDQVEERRLCPVHVFQDDDERLPIRYCLEEASDRREELVRSSRLLGQPDGGSDLSRDALAVGLAAQELRERIDSRAACLLEHDLAERPERDAVAVRRAAAGQDPRTGAERGGNLPTQPRFSDPCIAKDGEAVSRAVTNSSLEPSHDAGEVGVSSDHRRVKMTRERLSTGNEADEPPGSGRQRVYGLEQRRASEDSLGLLADEHILVRGCALDRRGDMHGVAGDRRPSWARAADDDLARLDAGADWKGNSRPRGGVSPSQRLADLDRSSHGAERVVLVGSGGAEDSDDHVADDVLDGCPVSDEDLSRHVARPGHDATQRFGVEAVANHGGGSEIQERDRDDLPFPLKPRLAGRWRFESDLRSRWRRLALEPGVLAKDRLLELLKAWAGLDSEVLHERLPRVPVHLEGLRLPTAPVERQHELRPQALTGRMLGNERLDVCNELACQAQREIGVDPVLHHCDAKFLERRDLPLGERLIGEVGQSATAPQIQRFSQLRRALSGLARSSLLDEPTEPVRVDVRRLDRKDVARRRGAQHGG